MSGAVTQDRRRSAIPDTVFPAHDFQAETERLLAGRTRDIKFSDVMHKRYLQKSWPQRSKIARSWMIWVTLIDLFFLPVSHLMVSHNFWFEIVFGLLLLPIAHGCVYLVWQRPRSDWVEGLSIVIAVNLVIGVYGGLGTLGGGFPAERYATGTLFAASIAMIVFDVSFIWTLAIAVSSLTFFLGFLLLNPQLSATEIVGTMIFYMMGATSVVSARRTGSLLARKSFLMALRDNYRSAALIHSNSQLEALATRDPMTGLANRRSMAAHIDRIWRDDTLPKSNIAFIMADLDRFKQLNDMRGHAAGDDCIQRVAGAIKHVLRADLDFAARYGGEEFLIVLTRVTKETALEIAERLRGNVEALAIPNPGNCVTGIVTMSLGVAFAADNIVPELVMQWADVALYDAKHDGRNRVIVSAASGCDAEHATLALSLDAGWDHRRSAPANDRESDTALPRFAEAL